MVCSQPFIVVAFDAFVQLDGPGRKSSSSFRPLFPLVLSYMSGLVLTDGLSKTGSCSSMLAVTRSNF